ncbi:MAG: hypothetical protein OXF96_02760 [Chloroflexi bacterium]|nr:hypothetical protein [Chloroflexota bacterium]
MANSRSLLSLIAQNDARGLEDAATDALRFVLSRSDSARLALSEFLADSRGPLPIEKVQTWAGTTHGAVPDLACYDGNDNLVAFIESKFWAQLTHHQPVTYWRELPNCRRAVLLFLAPDYRIDEGWLWNELVNRLDDSGHELGPASTDAGLTTAASKAGQRRLMLTSWKSLLGRIAQTAKADGDAQACFEISELQGLAADAVESDNPQHDDNLKPLIADVVKRLERSGWANTDGLGWASGYIPHGTDKYVYDGRNLRLGGAFAWIGIDDTAAKRMDRPLWLSFWDWDDGSASVGLEAVRRILGKLTEPGLEWRSKEACLPIDLPSGADREATLAAIVSELKRIANLIDPNGPTYRDSD